MLGLELKVQAMLWGLDYVHQLTCTLSESEDESKHLHCSIECF